MVVGVAIYLKRKVCNGGGYYAILHEQSAVVTVQTLTSNWQS